MIDPELLSELEAIGCKPMADDEITQLALSVLSCVYVDPDGKSRVEGFDPARFVPARLLVTLLRSGARGLGAFLGVSLQSGPVEVTTAAGEIWQADSLTHALAADGTDDPGRCRAIGEALRAVGHPAADHFLEAGLDED